MPAGEVLIDDGWHTKPSLNSYVIRAALMMRTLTGVDQSARRRELNGALARQKGRNTISLADALRLARAYQPPGRR